MSDKPKVKECLKCWAEIDKDHPAAILAIAMRAAETRRRRASRLRDFLAQNPAPGEREAMNTEAIIAKLDQHCEQFHECDPGPDEDLDKVAGFLAERSDGGFPCVMYVPQTENYRAALALITEEDIVCDMGAGDLRFGLLASEKAAKVYAVEMNPTTVLDALRIIGYDLPYNLIPVVSDWRQFPIPSDVTVLTCMVNATNVPKTLWAGHRLIRGVLTHGGGIVKEIQL